MKLCLLKALNLEVNAFFEHSNPGFLYAYPIREGKGKVSPEKREISPLFSRLCWHPVKREELLFLLRLAEEGKKTGVVSILGPDGSGKSYLIRRTVSLQPNSILLDASHKMLERHLEWVIKNGPWDIIGLENYQGTRAREAFKILFSSFPRSLFLLEGEEDGSFFLNLSPLNPETWREKLVFLDEEVKSKALSLVEEGVTPGGLISALMGKPSGKVQAIATKEEKLTRIKTSGKEREVENLLGLGKREEALNLIKRCRSRTCLAIKAYIEGREFLPSDRDSALSFLWAGKAQEKRGNPLLAEAYYREAYRKALEDLDGETAGRAFSDLGALFFRNGNLEQAEDFFRRSMMLLSSWGSEKAFTISAFNLAEVFFQKGAWDKAEKLYRMSYERSSREKDGLSHGYDAISLGYLLFLKGQKEEGKSLLREGAEIFLRAGNNLELEDLAWKVSEISIEEGSLFMEGNVNLPHPYPAIKAFLRGKEPEPLQDPWSLLLRGLRLRRKSNLASAHKTFLSMGREDLAHWVSYLMARENLWARSDLSRLRKALRWYKSRGCFRWKILHDITSFPEEKEIFPRAEEEQVLSKLHELARENWGDLPSAFLLFSEGEVLAKKISPPVPWLILRRHRENRLINSLEDITDPEERGEAFLAGIKSFILASEESLSGKILGFVSSPEENSFSPGDLETLKFLLRKASRAIKPKEGFMLLRGSSRPMLKVYAKIKRASSNSDPVLILGETGTGKELVARSISTLYGGKFVALNCASIPSELMESELFGYKKGAFTGANRDKRGLLEEADGGVLFLDEVGEMPREIQAKFLRALQDGHFRRLGDVRERKSTFKLIAATNRNLEEEVKAGKFRKDLYYRISQFVIKIPPLRERPEDIITLSEEFARKFSGRPVNLSVSLRKVLLSHSWPGNVRELQGVIKYAVNMMEEGESTLLPQHLPLDFSRDQEFLPLEEARQRWEKAYVTRALEITGGDVSRAASMLGISRQHLHKLIKKFQLK